MCAKINPTVKKKVSQEYKDEMNKKDEDWYLGDDLFQLEPFNSTGGVIELSSNFGSWEETKSNFVKSNDGDQMYLEVYNKYRMKEYAVISLSLEEMIEIRDYFSHKIDYLTGGYE